MEISLYQIDAFASKWFEGNPAAVCPLEAWLPDEIMQSIAVEKNLSETAFFVPKGDGYHIRWFTPVSEVDLCGHATLASAYVLFHILGYKKDRIEFESKYGIPEDPVTGSAYTQLAPYWASKTGKKRFRAKQLSSRGGELICELAGDRVLIQGKAIKYLEGKIDIAT